MSVIDDLKAAYLDVQKRIAEVGGHLNWLNNQYSINHYGGQSPSQFAAIVAPVQGSLDSLNTSASTLSVEIAQAQETERLAAEAAAVPVAATTSPTTATAPAAAPGPAGNPIFIPVQQAAAAIAGTSPLLIAAIGTAALVVYYKFFRRRR